jgi:nucleoside phosphorylase
MKTELNDPDVLVVTALTIEFNCVVNRLTDLRTVRHSRGTVYHIGRFHLESHDQIVAVVEVGKGNVAAAIETERAIAFFKPSYVAFVGVAGGLKDVSLGDVVIASKVFGYESGKEGEVFASRPQVYPCSYRMLQAARKLVQQSTDSFKVVIEPIVAGEKVVVARSSAIVAKLKEQCEDAAAIEMEGLGFLIAAHSNGNVEAFVVRGISDHLDDKGPDDKNNQATAAENAASVFFSLLGSIAPASIKQGLAPLVYESYDETITYDPTHFLYKFHTRKVVRNLGDFPFTRDFNQMWCNWFPEDHEKAEAYYAKERLLWNEIDFHCWDDAGPLDTLVLNSLGNRIDFYILFESKRRKRYVMPGTSYKYEYKYHISCNLFGPYYERFVHFPTKKLSLNLIFPHSPTPDVWGYVRTEIGPNIPISPAIEVYENDSRFSWESTNVIQGFSYALAWEHPDFSDIRI